MGREADAGCGVDRQTDVTGLGEGQAAAVKADSQPDLVAAGATVVLHGSLDAECPVEPSGRLLEHGEYLVADGGHALRTALRTLRRTSASTAAA